MENALLAFSTPRPFERFRMGPFTGPRDCGTTLSPLGEREGVRGKVVVAADSRFNSFSPALN
jgi:hypothetical protein